MNLEKTVFVVLLVNQVPQAVIASARVFSPADQENGVHPANKVPGVPPAVRVSVVNPVLRASEVPPV